MAGDGNGRPTFEEKKEAIRVRARECEAVATREKQWPIKAIKKGGGERESDEHCVCISQGGWLLRRWG